MPWQNYCRACLCLRCGRSLISIGIIGILLVFLTLPSHFTRALSSKTYSFTPTHAKNYTVSGVVAFENRSVGSNWYSSDWSYRQKVTLSKDMVAEELTDFPVLIRIDESVAEGMSSDASDLVITAADGVTKLSHELEGSAAMWVKVPRISQTTDTELYLYYGNETVVDDQQDAKQVWTNNFQAIHHLHGSPESAVLDATGNNIDGASRGGMSEGSNLQSGKIGRAYDFDGSNDYIETTDLNTWLGTTATLSFWLKTSQIGNNTPWNAPGIAGTEVVGANDIFWGWLDAAGRIGIQSGNGVAAKSTNPINDDVWHQVVMTREQSVGEINVYIDGELNTNFIDSGSTGIKTTSFSSFGREEDTVQAANYYDGLLDEFRISPVVRSGGWVTTAYRNQADVDEFLTFGSREEKSGEAGTGVVELKKDRPLSFASLSSFSVNSGGQAPTFQLSNDAGKTWLFYTASGWKPADITNPAHRSSVNDIAGHIASFPRGWGQLVWRAYVGAQASLDRISIDYIPASGTAPPVSLADSRVTAINQLFQQVYGRLPTQAEWLVWVNRLINGDKTTTAELLGAMQWHKDRSGLANVPSGSIVDGPTVEIRNGTNRQGLGGRTMTRIRAAGYPVSAVGNAQDFLRDTSKVYVINHAERQKAEELAATLEIPVGLDLPAGERATNADILLILGYDYAD